ncbi:hypothetical protein DL98DRAFT_599384 [Cadophora sp. DSE1049]|nr:hypothetical protein DL98DRAFT_599384 [Cadophora sp. DSE1049]
MDLKGEFIFLHNLGLNVTLFGKDHKKRHRGTGDRNLFVVVTRSDGDKLHYRDTIPEEDLSRLKNWIRCGDPTGLTAEWKEVHVGHSKWKAYLAGENQEIDCSGVLDEMFVKEGGENYTYARTGEAKWVKITHPEHQIRLSEHSGKPNSEAKSISIPSGLTAAEQDVYKQLHDAAQATKARNGRAPGVVAISDLAKDYDDLAAMVELKELDRTGNVTLEAYIANLEPARKRAIYGRVNLDSLGLQHVPIGVGTKASTEKHEEYGHEFESSIMPDEKAFQPNKDNFFENGFELLDLVFKRAIQEKRKVILVLLSPLTDIAEYTDTEDGLKTFQKAVGRVYMQGGYSISAEGIPIPRDDAANNKHFDWPAAERFHPRLENIPSDVYTKVAAYATNIPASIFNDLGDTKHPIGEDLQNRYQRQGVQFYKTACGPKPVNGITQEKFLHNLSSFYEKHPPGKQTSEKGTPLPEDGTPLPDPCEDFDPNEKFDPDKYEIIPYLTKGLMYDALPALATGGDHLVDILGVLDTESMANQTSIHKIIGTPKQDDLPANPNIHSERMAFVVSTILKGGLYDSYKKNEVNKDKSLDMSTSSNTGRSVFFPSSLVINRKLAYSPWDTLEGRGVQLGVWGGSKLPKEQGKEVVFGILDQHGRLIPKIRGLARRGKTFTRTGSTLDKEVEWASITFEICDFMPAPSVKRVIN